MDYQPDPNGVRPRHYPRWPAKRVRDWTASILPYQRFNVTRLTWQYLPAHLRCTWLSGAPGCLARSYHKN